jgi:hypothetical protein
MAGTPRGVLMKQKYLALLISLGVLFIVTVIVIFDSQGPKGHASVQPSKNLNESDLKPGNAPVHSTPAPHDGGDERSAKITFGDTTHFLAPNPYGEYARVIVPPSAGITAIVHFTNAKPGELVRVQAEDGGRVLGSEADVLVDNKGLARVLFEVSSTEGIQRLSMRHGGEARVLEFWVGNEPAVAVN